MRDRRSIQLHSSVGETWYVHTGAIVPLMTVFGYSEMSWMCQLFCVWIQTILMLCLPYALFERAPVFVCVDGSDAITPHAKNVALICGTIVRMLRVFILE